MFNNYKYTVADRFLKYVTIDTQSDPESSSVPSTEKQKDLSNLLVRELHEIGLADAHLDDKGYVYATLPSNTDKEVPVICFCSHVDTSPDCSGKDVKPQVHTNYQGQVITYPQNPEIELDPRYHPDLNDQIGKDVITSDGTTLLGADNKAGVAEIMDAVNFLSTHPELKHGKIRILFTPDEEIGRGVDHVDMKKLGADYGYTIDGEKLGSIEDETFSADGAILTIKGVSAHPGFAKGKMESALKIASEIIDQLPKDRLSPETTEKNEGFVHPTSIQGGIEETVVKFIIRAFDNISLKTNADVIRETADKVLAKFPNSKYKFEVYEQYRNMKQILDQHPRVVEFAKIAVKRTGVEPNKKSIRGGTDGSRLSYMGLPCPNIFAGEHAFHSKIEWVSVQDMQKAVQTIVHLSMVWEENAS
ncbi:MAG: peptidase T [Flavobacteriales bacterium]|nr:peptidase T [Flavobacteriales bacterium]